MKPLIVAFYVQVGLNLLSTHITLVLVQLHMVFDAMVVHPTLDVNCVRAQLASVDSTRLCLLKVVARFNILSGLLWGKEGELLGKMEVSQQLLLLACALLLLLLFLALHQLSVRFLVLLELGGKSEYVVAELAAVEVDVEMVIKVALDEVRLVLLHRAVAQGALIHPAASIVDGVATHHLVCLFLGEKFTLG